jgi:hypothetical protein
MLCIFALGLGHHKVKLSREGKFIAVMEPLPFENIYAGRKTVLNVSNLVEHGHGSIRE